MLTELSNTLYPGQLGEQPVFDPLDDAVYVPAYHVPDPKDALAEPVKYGGGGRSCGGIGEGCAVGISVGDSDGIYVGETDGSLVGKSEGS